MENLSRADVPGMLVAALDLATAGSGRLAPAHLNITDVQIVSNYIGAAGVNRLANNGAWQWKCPSCGGWEFGPTIPIEEAVCTWLHGGRLPAAPMLAGACLTCEHITSPTGVDVVDPDDLCSRCKGTGVDPDHASEEYTPLGTRVLPEPCEACDLIKEATAR
jgi:hypothetical protein